MTEILVTVTFSLNSLPPWEIFHAFLWSADVFFKINFRKILSGIPSECQTDWIQIRPDILTTTTASYEIKDLITRILAEISQTKKEIQCNFIGTFTLYMTHLPYVSYSQKN